MVGFTSTAFDGLALDALTELSYWTHIENRPAGSCGAPWLLIRLDTDGDNIQDETMYFDPCYQTPPWGVVPYQAPIVEGTWQEWDAMAGVWRLYPEGAPPSSGPSFPRTIASTAAELTGAMIVTGADGLGGIQVVVGTGGINVDANAIYHIDGFTIGADGVPTITYDFEP